MPRMLFNHALRTDSLLAGLALGVDLLKGMFLASRDPFHFPFPLQGIVERNLHLSMGKDAGSPEILPAIDAMHRGCFVFIASLALHLVDILYGARD